MIDNRKYCFEKNKYFKKLIYFTICLYRKKRQKEVRERRGAKKKGDGNKTKL